MTVSASCSVSAYPQARRDESIQDDFHGQRITDPYRWLEDPDDAETQKFVDELNKVSAPFISQCSFRDSISTRLKQLWDYPKYGCPRREGDHYFYNYNTGLQNQSVLYIQDSLKGDSRIFLDPNLLSADGTTAVTKYAYTDDGTTLAYGISEKGSDWTSVKFKRIPTGDEFPDVLHRLKFSSLAWTIDNKGVFYMTYPRQQSETSGTNTEKHQFHSMFYHYLGTQQSEDILCVDFPNNPDYLIGAEVTECGQYLIVSVDKGCDPTNLLFFYDLSNGKILSKLSLQPLVDKFEAKFDFISNDGPLFTVLTNFNAPMFKLIQIDSRCPAKENWKTLVEEKATSKLDWATCVNHNKLVLCYMEDVKNALHVHDSKSGEHLYNLPIDIGTVVSFSGAKKYSEIFYMFQSFLSPGVIYHCNLDEPKPTPAVFRKVDVNGFDSSLYETKQVFYASRDGTKIPMFLMHRKGLELNAENPTVLYGYGGFNIALQPSFSVARIMFLQHFRGVYAVANLRGGCEYGERWHEGGMLSRKQNVFDDFIAAAEYLLQNKYTNKRKLAIQGGSNGGLLVAACVNQRPDLFGAVLNHVGVMDMLRYHQFTIGQAWAPEFGSADNPEAFQHLIKYSPLHNLKQPSDTWQYPAMLLLTADHDDRVVPSHSLKYIAQLYHLLKDCPQQTNPVLIRVETKAGHGAGKPTAKVIEELVDVYSFLSRALGLKWYNDMN